MQEPIEKNDILYRLFYDFYLSRETSLANADVFARKMTHFLNMGSHELTTLCMNLNDGIGDFASQLYFIKKLDALFAGKKNVNVQHISLVGEKKLELAEKILTENDRSSTRKIPIFKMFRNHYVGNPNNAEQKELHKRIYDSDFIFNFALPLCPHKKMLELAHGVSYKPCFFSFDSSLLKVGSHLVSWTQYEFNPPEKIQDWKIDNLINRDKIYQYSGSAFVENEMGMLPHQAGIRFFDDITDHALSAREVLLNAFSTNIKGKLLFSQLVNDAFAAGYLQDKNTIREFVILTCMTTPGHENINILVNEELFIDSLGGNGLRDLHFRLRNSNFCSIEFFYSDREPIQIESATGNKVIRIFDFKKVSEQLKSIFFGLSEAAAASGDSSLSELISIGLAKNPALPLIQPYLTHGNPYQSIIAVLKEMEVEETKLFQYMRIMEETLVNPYTSTPKENIHIRVSTLKSIKKDRQEIINEWHAFCTYIYKNRQETKHFQEVIVTYVFHHLLKNNQIDECINLAALFGNKAFLQESILHLAIKLNNAVAVKKILDSNLGDINQKHSFHSYTPLHLAIHYDNKEIVKLLFQYGADDTLTDICELTPLQVAQQKNNRNMEVLLQEQHVLKEKSVFSMVQKSEYDNHPLPLSLFAAYLESDSISNVLNMIESLFHSYKNPGFFSGNRGVNITDVNRFENELKELVGHGKILLAFIAIKNQFDFSQKNRPAGDNLGSFANRLMKIKEEITNYFPSISHLSKPFCLFMNQDLEITMHWARHVQQLIFECFTCNNKDGRYQLINNFIQVLEKAAQSDIRAQPFYNSIISALKEYELDINYGDEFVIFRK